MIYPEIPLPRLLDSDDLTKTDRFIRPISVDINQKIVPLSYASMNLPQDESVPGRSYVELFTSTGSAGIYRVTSPQDAFGEDVISCELEHAITEVGDWLYEGELSEMIPAKDAIGRIFNDHYAGNKWQLGSTTALGSTSVAVEISYRNVLEGILGVLDQVPDCMMTFNFSTTPWTFGFAKKGTTVQAEGRLSRNVTSAKITYDDSSLCTRAFYQYTQYNVDGSSETKWEHKDADASSKTKYGIVERPVSTGSGYTKDEAEYVVTRYLAKHKKPLTSISIEALELSSITGESLDRFEIGRKFRLALPDYGIEPVEDVITELSWKGLYSGFEQVTVNLGDQEDGVVNFLHDVDSSGGSSSGGRAGSARSKQNNDFRTAINRTAYSIRLEAYERVKYDNWNYSYIDITACYIRQEVGQTANGLYSRIEQTASAIRSTVEDRYNRMISLVKQTASSWDARVAGVVDSSGKITAASIGIAINKSGSNAYINADHVNITGSVRMNEVVSIGTNGNAVFGRNVTIGTASSGYTQINGDKITADTFSVRSGGSVDFVAGTGSQASAYSLTASKLATMVESFSVSGNTLTLNRFNGTHEDFSKAIASWNKRWRNGVFTGTAQPQNQSVTTTLANDYSVSGNPVQCDVTGRASATGKYMKQDIVVQYVDGEDSKSTGRTLSVVVNATDVYNYGKNSGSHSIDIPSNQIYTTGNNPQGTKLNTLRTRYEEARADSEFVCFRVDCGGEQKWYYMEP